MMHMRMYVYNNTYIYIDMYICTRTCMCICMCICICVRTCICIRCTCVCMCLHMFMYMRCIYLEHGQSCRTQACRDSCGSSETSLGLDLKASDTCASYKESCRDAAPGSTVATESKHVEHMVINKVPQTILGTVFWTYSRLWKLKDGCGMI